MNPTVRRPLSISSMEVGIASEVGNANQRGHKVASSRTAKMFGRNTVASTVAFVLDLLILWALVELLAIPRVAAAVVAFMVPMIVFYVLSRTWVFPNTRRKVGTGFVYFMLNVGIGFLVMLAVFWTLLESTQLYYLVARVAASVVSGIVIFLLNGIFNFKQL